MAKKKKGAAITFIKELEIKPSFFSKVFPMVISLKR